MAVINLILYFQTFDRHFYILIYQQPQQNQKGTQPFVIALRRGEKVLQTSIIYTCIYLLLYKQNFLLTFSPRDPFFGNNHPFFMLQVSKQLKQHALYGRIVCKWQKYLPGGRQLYFKSFSYLAYCNCNYKPSRGKNSLEALTSYIVGLTDSAK